MSGSSDRILFSETEIAARVAGLARTLSSMQHPPETIAPILTGAFVFAADLARALARLGLDLPVDFMWLRSYGDNTHPGAVTVLKAPSATVRSRRVLLVDGVLDTGATLARAKELLVEAGAASVFSAVLVLKPYDGAVAVPDHACFHAGSAFLFGYGMDRAGLSRGLPDIRVRG